VEAGDRKEARRMIGVTQYLHGSLLTKIIHDVGFILHHRPAQKSRMVLPSHEIGRPIETFRVFLIQVQSLQYYG
jgi:hypothetical protein